MKSTFLISCILLSLLHPPMEAQGEKSIQSLLASGTYSARLEAMERIVDLGQESAGYIDLLSETAISDNHYVIRGAAVRAIGNSGLKNADVITVILKAIQDENWVVQHNASLTLTRMGKEVLPFLNDTLNNANDPLQFLYLSEALLKLDPTQFERVIQRLVSLSHHQEEQIRAKTAHVMGFLGNNGHHVIESIRRLLNDASLSIRQNALVSLQNFGSSGRSAVSDVIALLKSDEDRSIRLEAATTLGALKEPSAAVIPALIDALDDEQGRVIASASQALSQIGNPALSYFEKALIDREETIRVGIIDTIWLGNMNQGASFLLEALSDKSVEVRQQAAFGLGIIGDAGDMKTIKALETARNDPSDDVRLCAFQSLDRLLDRPLTTNLPARKE